MASRGAEGCSLGCSCPHLSPHSAWRTQSNLTTVRGVQEVEVRGPLRPEVPPTRGGPDEARQGREFDGHPPDVVPDRRLRGRSERKYGVAAASCGPDIIMAAG